MDQRLLESFLAVADAGGVSAAALRLNMTQPTVSRRIAALEEILGVTLFDRIGKQIRLSGDGRMLVGPAAAALEAMNALAHAAQEVSHGSVGLLTIGATSQVIENNLAGFLPAFMASEPGVELRILQAGGQETVDAVSRGDVQVGLVSEPAQDAGLGIRPLGFFDLLVVRADQVAGVPVLLADLAETPLLLPDRRFQVRALFDAACRLENLTPNIVLESDAPHSLVALARAGIGAAILSGIVRPAVPTAPLHAKTGPLRLKFAAIWDSRRVLPRPASIFIDAFEAHFRMSEGR